MIKDGFNHLMKANGVQKTLEPTGFHCMKINCMHVYIVCINKNRLIFHINFLYHIPMLFPPHDCKIRLARFLASSGNLLSSSSCG